MVTTERALMQKQLMAGSGQVPTQSFVYNCLPGTPNPTEGNGQTYSHGELRDFFEMVNNALITRSEVVEKWLDPRRDYDKECGYPLTSEIQSSHYRRMYDREPIARRAIELMPKECWRVPPSVFETADEKETEFEKVWSELSRGLRSESWFQDQEGNPVWEHLSRLDKLCGIGQFGILLLGLDDGKALNEPVDGLEIRGELPVEQDVTSKGTPRKDGRTKPAYEANQGPVINRQGNVVSWPVWNLTVNEEKTKGRKLLYLRSFSEDLVMVSRWESNPASPRYCQPVEYSVTLNDTSTYVSGIGLPLTTTKVHWTRVIHVADNLDSSEHLGTPRLRMIYNRLIDLTKLYGGSAEMYWQGAFPGINLSTHPQLGGDVTIDTDEVATQMARYMNGLQRVLAFTGISASMMSPTVVDPKSQIEVQIEAVCIALECPIRIFKGSERGELASSQDDTTWKDRVVGRQNNFVTPRIIVPFLDCLILVGVLPKPIKGYSVDWPDIYALNDKEVAEQAAKIVETLVKYVSGGVDGLVEPMTFLTEVLGWSSEKAQAALEATLEHMEEQEEEKGQAPPKQEEPEEGKEATENAEFGEDEYGTWRSIDRPELITNALMEGKELGKPFRTPSGPKKFAVYTKNDKGNVVLVRFGDPDMEIKRDDPERRKSFRARHGCDDPGPKWKPRYWSCKMWSSESVSDILNEDLESQIQVVANEHGLSEEETQTLRKRYEEEYGDA